MRNKLVTHLDNRNPEHVVQDTVRILRLEARDNNKIGIYRLLEEVTERYTAVPRFHPDFDKRCTTLALDARLIQSFRAEDGLGFHDYHCGFANLEQLFNWFPKHKLQEMNEEAGQYVRLGLYDCPSKYAIVGNAQVFFAIDMARKVRDLDPCGCNEEDCLREY